MNAFVEVPSSYSFVAPDGSAWVYWADDELCVGYRDDPEAEPTCSPWERNLPYQGVSWSSDAKRVLFTQNFYQSQREPDVNVFDAESGRIDVLTDDGVDDYLDGGGDIDLFPFFGPDDEVYFFRFSSIDEPPALYRLVDGTPEPVDGDQLGEGWPTGPVLRSGENTWTYAFAELGTEALYASLTFDDSGSTVSVDDLWAPTDVARLAGAAPDRLLTVSIPPRGQLSVPSVIAPDKRSAIELPIDDQAVSDGFTTIGATLSADGTQVLELRSNGDGRAQFTVWRIDLDGGTVTVQPTQVGTVTDERIGAELGAEPGTLGWDGGATLTASGRSGVFVFDVTIDEP